MTASAQACGRFVVNQHKSEYDYKELADACPPT